MLTVAVEELIGGMVYRGIIDNFDKELKQGIYWVDAKNESGEYITELTPGGPIGAYKWGTLLVFKSIYGTCTSQIYLPVCYNKMNNQMYWRTSNETNANKGVWRKETSEQII